MDDYLSVAEQLNILFDQRRKPNGESYTLREVSEATGISLPSISQLRNGRSANPQLTTLRALCRFFNVPLAYFDTTTEAECLSLIVEGRQAPSEDLQTNLFSTLAADLSPEGQRDLLTILKWAQAAERHQNGTSMPRLTDHD